MKYFYTYKRTGRWNWSGISFYEDVDQLPKQIRSDSFYSERGIKKILERSIKNHKRMIASRTKVEVE